MQKRNRNRSRINTRRSWLELCSNSSNRHSSQRHSSNRDRLIDSRLTAGGRVEGWAGAEMEGLNQKERERKAHGQCGDWQGRGWGRGVEEGMGG